MYLSPTEEDRLRVFVAAELARRALARGLKLNAPEAIALTCDEMHMAARAVQLFDEVLEAGRQASRRDRLIDWSGRPRRRDPARGAPRRGKQAHRSAETLEMTDRIDSRPAAGGSGSR